jgi:hypothetical protein
LIGPEHAHQRKAMGSCRFYFQGERRTSKDLTYTLRFTAGLATGG